MHRCKNCLMLDTKPGVKLNKDGICQACLHAEEAKKIDYKGRQYDLINICNKYRSSNGSHDCIIPVSGGKDSTYQTYLMKEVYNMNPLLVSVTDEFGHTDAGAHNYNNLASMFGCDHVTYRINPEAVKMTSVNGFKKIGATNWLVDYYIYALPFRMAIEKNIKLICYGEDVVHHFGGVFDEETYSAKRQIDNDIVSKKGYKLLENMHWFKPIDYPTKDEIEQYELEPIFLGYFHNWYDKTRTDMIYKWGFHGLNNEWNRKGYIDDYIQVDSVGYLVNYMCKYYKLGIGRATDIGAQLVREGRLTTEQCRQLILESDGLIDYRIVEDYCKTMGISVRAFWSCMDQHVNQLLFDDAGNGMFELKKEYLP